MHHNGHSNGRRRPYDGLRSPFIDSELGGSAAGEPELRDWSGANESPFVNSFVRSGEPESESGSADEGLFDPAQLRAEEEPTAFEADVWPAASETEQTVFGEYGYGEAEDSEDESNDWAGAGESWNGGN